VEVKVSRGDLLRDNKNSRARKRLEAQTLALAEAEAFTATLLGRTELDTDTPMEPATGPDATALAEDVHSAVLKKLESSKSRLQRFSTKFHDPAYLRCADFHYIAAPHGLVWPSEMPPFWGLINDRSETLLEATPKQVRRVTTHILRNIAKSNTRDLMKACGIEVRTQDGRDEG
jgi:hypothetical protein